MSMVPALRKLIDQLEIKYRSSVSESTWTKIAGVTNFIVLRNHQEKQFFLNGPYSNTLFGPPNFKLDGMTIFQFDAEIFGVYMFNLVAGSVGTTELDCRIKPQLSGAFTSIFTTRPKIQSAAGNDVWVGIGDAIANTTAPVLTSGTDPLQVNAGDGLVIDLIQAQTGGENTGLLIHYRPR